MREEYDFCNAEQGKFYRPMEQLDIPIYLDKDIKEFFFSKLKDNSEEFSLSSIVNALLKKDIEISKKLSY
jgi:hypothetical protein